ncbi:LysE family translocator [Variovorax sp. NFACC27]|uniref:LysE family translocator n=1 Tax=unclassified Variovorax TaxID=663243 RepID=UPI00089770F2|nr:LysE family translocator [Variovorax sp. YR750]SEF19747.1 Threonine/homoserine/homoserine lactone efflux protein [Variovorax sp. NFACC28]SEF67719.1 Threonine/homoserine/homoserine lactone efflux protein [Variovorax sp. NFACC29]SFB75292.1 Threonine/homoserine/homoserine lactone efflux protein [Variovorax sp. NFACC26]SFG54150.1 Threonine/homoserine/homoserine lactone efflux protein [Variovorax sp. NFACC27]SEM27096.1 Threonine/homoserine/homoserine lactone efflux protein [Variovorax sp. YR750]
MIGLATLSLFLLAVLALFLSPGPNMAFVLSHGVAHGPRGGFAAAIGISAADLVHTLFAATGVTALVAAWPPSFDVLRYAGALYLVWLAVQALRSGGLRMDAQAQPAGFGRIVRMALLNNLVNPKALLFFMVFLPQFVDPARGSVPLQLVQLGVVLSMAALAFNTLLGACSGQIGRWLHSRPGAARFQSSLLAVVMLGLAVRLLLLDRPSPR